MVIGTSIDLISGSKGKSKIISVISNIYISLMNFAPILYSYVFDNTLCSIRKIFRIRGMEVTNQVQIIIKGIKIVSILFDGPSFYLNNISNFDDTSLRVIDSGVSSGDSDSVF